MDIFVDGKLVKTLWLDGQSWKRPIAPPEGLSGHYVAMMNQNEAYDPVKLAWARTGDSAPSCRFQIWDLEVEENGWTEMEFGRQYISQKGFAVRGVGNQKTAASDTVYNYFNLYNGQGAADVRISGDILAVLDKTPPAVLGQFAVNGLFRNQGNVMDVMGLSCSPAAISSDHALQFLFDGSSVQETPFWPGLSCTQASEYEYGENFLDCTQLKTARIQLPWVADGVDHSVCEGPAFRQFEGNDGIMSAYVKSHFGDGRVQGDSLPKLIGYKLLRNCSNLSCVSTDIASWGEGNFPMWLEGCAVSGQFWCPSALGVDSTISRGINRAPEGWLVGNPDVEGEDAANFVLRDASVESQVDEAPDFSSVQVWNAQTLQKLTLSVDWVPVYQTHSEPAAYTWSISGIGNYHGSLTGLPYEVVDANNVKFTALEANSALSVHAVGSAPEINVEYKVKGGQWTPMVVDQTVVTLLQAGDAVQVRGVGNSAWGKSADNNWNLFRGVGAFKIEGPVASLLDKDATGLSADSALRSTFRGCKAIKDAKGLIIPETLAVRGVQWLLAETGISAVPDSLPAKDVPQDAYNNMFSNCTSLSDASNLVFGFEQTHGGVFWQFFGGCNQLTAAPWIPNATWTASNNYTYMFQNCSRLAQLSTDFTTWREGNYWMTGVSGFGTFYCKEALGKDENIQRGTSRCPNNWLVANWDVSEENAYNMASCFTRGSYTTAFMYDGAAHVPDVSNLSVYNRKTATKLTYGQDYTAGAPAGQDNTSMGNKVVVLDGASPYYGQKTLSYVIATNNITGCQVTPGYSIDGETPPLTVYQPQLQRNLVYGTEFLSAYTVAGDVCTISLSGIGALSGVTSVTCDVKASDPNPLTIYKHDPSDVRDISVSLKRVGGSSYYNGMQLQVDDGNGWQDMTLNTWYHSSTAVKIRAKYLNERLGYSDNNYNWIDCGYDAADAADVDLSGRLLTLLDRVGEITSFQQDSALNTVLGNNEKIIDASRLSCGPVLVNRSYAMRRIMSSRNGVFGSLTGRPSRLTAAMDFNGISCNEAQSYACISWCEACPDISSADYILPWTIYNGRTSSGPAGTAMFINCKGLKRATVRSHFGDGRPCSDPANTYIGNELFNGCSSLSFISTDLTAWPSRGFTVWVDGVSSNGIFVCPSALGTNETIERGTNRCPANWQVINVEDAYNSVRFTAAAGGAKVGIVDRQEAGLAPSISMLSSTDGLFWGDYSVGGKIQLQEGETAYFKAKTTNTKMGSDWGRANSFFVEDGQASAAGPLGALLGQEPAQLTDFCFYNLFAYCSGLVDASGIEFPASKPQGSACYSSMFWNCSALTAVPETTLPGGDNLDSDVYNSMFRWCTGLSDASRLKLPTAAGQNCFMHMFEGCVSLTAAPQVPAPGTGSDSNFFADMFNGCTSLAQISAKFDEWPSGTNNWVNGVSANGTFYCYESLGTDQTIMRGVSKCPTGWNVVNIQKVKYLQWINTNEVKMPLGVYNDEADMSCFTTVSGDAGGGAFVYGSDRSTDTWRFFNLDDWTYMDARSSRAQQPYSYNLNGWNDISAWCCGFTIINSKGQWTKTMGSPLPTGHKELSTWSSGRGGYNFKRLEFWKGAEVLADMRPAIVENVVGFWDVVNEEFRAPTEGVWLSGPEIAKPGSFWKLSVVKAYSSDTATQACEWYLYDSDMNRVNQDLTLAETQSYDDFSFLQAGQCCKGSNNYYYHIQTQDVDKLFDGQQSTKWCPNPQPSPQLGPFSVVLRLPVGVNPVSYNFRSAEDGNPARNWVSWTIESSDDGSSWTTVDEKTDYTTGLPQSTYQLYNNGTAFQLSDYAPVTGPDKWVRTNNAVVDTGYKPTVNTSISCWLSGSAQGDAYVGFYTGNDTKDWRIFDWIGQDAIYLDMGNDGSSGDGKRMQLAPWDYTAWNSVSAYNFGGGVRKGAGALTSVAGTSASVADWDANATIKVGGYNTSKGQDFAINGLRIFESGVLVKDFVLSGQNGVIGFAETIGGTFYAPASGTWLSGSSS